MEKKRLKQHKALAKEVPKLRKEIERLQKRLDNLPEVIGKVTKSSDDFPYVEQHVTVRMAEPKAATEIKKQIWIKERRLEQVESERTEIEKFIASIPNSTDRQIFEGIYLEGKKQREVADEVGLERSSISKRLSAYL